MFMAEIGFWPLAVDRNPDPKDCCVVRGRWASQWPAAGSQHLPTAAAGTKGDWDAVKPDRVLGESPATVNEKGIRQGQDA